MDKAEGSGNSSSATSAESLDSNEERICPICCEQKDDIAVLDHWEVHGDISSHKMCAACRARNTSNDCPFCREIICKNEFLEFIHEFLERWRTTVGTDPNAMAAVFERWQLLEMQLDGSPAVIRRVAQLILADDGFIDALRTAVERRQEWVRDIAGVIFRFWGLLQDDAAEMRAVSADSQLLVNRAVEMILAPFERPHAPVLMDGHFYGALYMQVLTPWLCAQAAGFRTAQLRQLVQRTGRAIVHCYTFHGSRISSSGSRVNNNINSNSRSSGSTALAAVAATAVGAALRQRVTERMHPQYLTAAQSGIWGSEDCDIMWNAFYA